MLDHRITAFAMKRFAVVLLCLSLPALAADQARLLLQMTDYVGVDYPAAVADGEVANAAEYAEMREFADRIRDGVATLPAAPGRDALAARARTLEKQIMAKAPAGEIVATTRAIRELLLRHYDVIQLPRQAPDLRYAESLYQANCAACHGAAGHGDGAAAASLEPSPTDFHDLGRATQRSLFGLYNTITLGVDGTAMKSFAGLSDTERWALAFYVGSFYADEPLLAKGAQSWRSGMLDLQTAVTRAPAELGIPNNTAVAAYLRNNPGVLFAGKPSPIDTAIIRLQESLAQYRAGDRAAASQLAISAYLEGFELAEAALVTASPELMRRTEDTMLAVRHVIQQGAPPAKVEAAVFDATALLEEARRVLTEGNLSAGVAFTSSLVILLREGLEAILILGAIAAFLIKTGRRDALKYMHYGWIGALAAGAATWAASAYLFNISGAARELTEGITALAAAGILFYVGFWMHSQLNARRWNQFLKTKVQSALNEQALWTIALIAFVAVYREVFETVLFYQALWAQLDADTHGAVFAGVVVAAVTLVALTWGIFKFGLRIPLKPFFAISGTIMFVLAVVFAGKGIVALQEAGKLPISPIGFPRIEVLGIYPNAQSLALQALLIVMALALVFNSRRPAQTA